MDADLPQIFDTVWLGDREPDPWSDRVPAIQSTVDLKTANTTSVGSNELKTLRLPHLQKIQHSPKRNERS
jgi:hypothetical protein